MIRPAFFILLAASMIFGSPAPGHAQSIYRWHDANGGLHFSNLPTRTPEHATAAELPPLGSIQIPATATRKRQRGSVDRGRVPSAAPCGPADPGGLATAVSGGLAEETPEADLTLLVGGLPLATSPDATVDVLITSWDPDAPQAPLSQSAIAYPTGSSCPTAPPLVRYPTNAHARGASRGLCDDYRRAFAQVGVATSRDAGIGRSFGDIARAFVRIAEEGNHATASGFRAAVADGMFTSDAMQLAPHMTVPLDPWIVAAHVSQTRSLAYESDQLVEQLAVALEEIDRAARASGCWN